MGNAISDSNFIPPEKTTANLGISLIHRPSLYYPSDMSFNE